MRKTLTPFALPALALALLAGAADATTLPYKGFDRLAAEADGVVVGTVRTVQSSMDARRDIDTFVTFDELQVVGGRYAAPTLTLRVKGGVVDHEMLRVEGAPQFRQGERVLMFVQGNGRELVPLVGWSQGLFRLVPDGAGDFTVADADGHAVLAVEGDRVRTEAAETAQDVRLMGEPDAIRVQHRAAATQASGGRSDDGSPVRTVATRAAGERPMSAQAFLALARDRVGHRAPAAPLSSVEPGSQAMAPAEVRDARRHDALANAVTRPVTDSGAPALPQRAEEPAAAAARDADAR